MSSTRGDDLVQVSVLDVAAFRGGGPEAVIRTGRGDDEVELLAVAGEGEALERASIATGRGDDPPGSVPRCWSVARPSKRSLWSV